MNPLTSTWEVSKSSACITAGWSLDHSVTGCLALKANWKGRKAQYVDASWADQANLSVILNSHPLLQQQWTISWSDYSVWQKCNEHKNAVVWLKRSSKALPKTKPVPKKVHGGRLVVSCISSTATFWILAEPLHLRSMLSKWMWCTKTHKSCSWRAPTDRAQFSWQCPTVCPTTKASKAG